MNIKKNIWMLAAAALLTTGFVACSDWTDVEALDKEDYSNVEPAKTEAYYKALREYKKSKHSLSFGWFSGWSEPGVMTANMLSGLPDSMDMVSLWDNSGNLSEGKKRDLKFAQQVKGLRVLKCTFIQYVGKSCTPTEFNVDEKTREKFWGWVDDDDEAIQGSLAKYAKALADSIHLYDYDGLDIDFEPGVDAVDGKLDENPKFVRWFLAEMCQLLGPKSNSGKMLVIDGEITKIHVEDVHCFDYLISQAYTVSGGTPPPNATGRESSLDSRLTSTLNKFRAQWTDEQITNRLIVTENMESAMDALNGGFFWRFRDNTTADKSVCPSLVGFARWQPLNGYMKGGFGGYRFDAESANKPAYKWMRRAIQAANPAIN